MKSDQLTTHELEHRNPSGKKERCPEIQARESQTPGSTLDTEHKLVSWVVFEVLLFLDSG